MRAAALLLVSLAGLGAWPAAAEEPTPASRREPPAERQKPQEFWARAELSRPVELATVDATLLAAAIFHATNDARRAAGLRPLRHAGALAAAAEDQAGGMAWMLRVQHEHPLPGHTSVSERVERAGGRFQAVGENVAAQPLLDLRGGTSVRVVMQEGVTTYRHERDGGPVLPHTYASLARALVQSWLDSPGHRENVLARRFRFLGCGGHAARVPNGVEMLFAAQVFGE